MWPFKKKEKTKSYDPLNYFPPEAREVIEDLYRKTQGQEERIEELQQEVNFLRREIANRNVIYERNENIDQFFEKFLPEDESPTDANGNPNTRSKFWQVQAQNRTARVRPSSPAPIPRGLSLEEYEILMKQKRGF